jgi:hypothetical protein
LQNHLYPDEFRSGFLKAQSENVISEAHDVSLPFGEG